MLKGAIVGFGFISAKGHYPAYRQRDDVEIAAIADLCPARLEAARAAAPKARLYSNHSELLANEPRYGEILAQAEFVDWSATSTNFADQLAPFGIKIKVRTLTYTQVPIEVGKGNLQLAMQSWGAGDPHPRFSFVQDVTLYLPPVTNGPGSSFSLTQATRDFGTVNLGKMITDSGLSLDVAKQKALVRRMALIFNDLLPVIPLWERYGNNPTRPGVRVAGWPKPGDPIYLNSPYSDAFVIMMLLTGQLHAV